MGGLGVALLIFTATLLFGRQNSLEFFMVYNMVELISSSNFGKVVLSACGSDVMSSPMPLQYEASK